MTDANAPTRPSSKDGSTQAGPAGWRDGGTARPTTVICDRLLAAAECDDLLYAVPGSPFVLEGSVRVLRRRSRSVRVLPAVSFIDLAWDRLAIDPVEAGVRLVDGLRFAAGAAGQTGPLLVANCYSREVLSEIKEAVSRDPGPVLLLHRLGLEGETVRETAWSELDSAVEADPCTSLFIPELHEPVAAELVRFDRVARTLRERCPWDREQTHASLRRHLLEEAYETLEAIDGRSARDDSEPDGQLDEHLMEELGDLLYQVWFHARLAAERGAFTMGDVARGVREKLVSRHPHVFGDAVADDASTARSNWEMEKKREKGRSSVMDGIPPTLPALLRAVKILRRADSAGLAVKPEDIWKHAHQHSDEDIWKHAHQHSDEDIWKHAHQHSDESSGTASVGHPGETAGVLERALAALRSTPDEQCLGEVLLAVVELGRRLRLDPEDALRAAATWAEGAFRAAEREHTSSRPGSAS